MLPSLLEWLKRVFGSFGQIHWTVHLIYAQTSYEGIKCIKAKEEYLRSYCLLYILWLTHSELKVGFGILWLYTNSLMKQSFTIEDRCSFSLLVKIIKKWSFEAWSLNHSGMILILIMHSSYVKGAQNQDQDHPRMIEESCFKTLFF